MTFAPPKSAEEARKRAIYERSQGCCAYCGLALEFHSLGWEVEHVIPRASGAGNERENLVAACAWCNRTKAGNGPAGFRAIAEGLIDAAFSGLLVMLQRFGRDPHMVSIVQCVELAEARWKARAKVGSGVQFARDDLLGK